MDKEEKVALRDKLVSLAKDIGYSVELESKMPERILEQLAEPDAEDYFNPETGEIIQEFRPAGDCAYLERRIRVREGKGLNGQVSTLVHELCHAMGLGGLSWYSLLGEGYIELIAESVTQHVTQIVGIDRTHKTAPRMVGYGFKGFSFSPATQALVNVFCDYLGYDRVVIQPITFSFSGQDG